MRTKEERNLLLENTRNQVKMAMGKTATMLAMIVLALVLIFSMTEAYPTTTTTESVELSEENQHLANNSRLVITNVVKTIEFEVGVLEDDGELDENSTALNGTDFYETDIHLLNLDLLKEVVNKADGDENGNVTTTTTMATAAAASAAAATTTTTSKQDLME